jgi:hypothetical protein
MSKQATTDSPFTMTPQRWYDLMVEVGITREDVEPTWENHTERIVAAHLVGPTIIPPQERDDFLIILPPGFELPEDEWLEIEKLFGVERILKGSTVVGWVNLIRDDGDEHPNTLRIGQLVGTRACHKANVDYDGIVNDYNINWDRLDNDRVLDEQPWGVEPR